MPHLNLLLALFLMVAGLAGPPSATAAVTAKDVVAALEQGYETISDLQADFSQRTAIASLGREERGAGELLLKKAAGSPMFRFNYTKPRQQIISNGKTVWYYLPENKQVLISDVAALFEGGNAMALNYLTGMGRLSADFTAALATEGGKKGEYLIDLVPRKSSAMLTKLQLAVSSRAVDEFMATGKVAEAFPVTASVVHDQLGNRTRIEYSRIRINRGLGSDRFTFKAPAGVEIIKQ